MRKAMNSSVIFLFTSSIAFVIPIDLPAQQALQRGSNVARSDTEGEYRTVRSGLWSGDSTWARCVAGAWITPASPPDSSSGVISVRNGHTVTIRSTLVYDQLVVEEGAQVIVGTGVSHTLADGPGNDLTINGTWLNQGGTWAVVGGARWAVNDGGTFVHNTSSGISSPFSKAILSRLSNFVYRGGASVTPASAFAGRSYGNLSFDTSGGTWTCSASGTSALTINGNLSIGPGVKWNTGGFAGMIAVDGSTAVAGEWSGSGSGNQGVHTFKGPFAVHTGGKYSLATTGGTQGGLVFQSDLTVNGSLVSPSNRPILFGGQNSQLITGSALLLFKNGFKVNNPAGIALGCSVSVDDTLEMVAGDLRTGVQTLTLGESAVLMEKDSSAVIGRISTIRTLQNAENESFGNLGLEIKPTGYDPGATTLTRVTGTPLPINVVRTIDRYFDISPSLSGGFLAAIILHFSDSELNGVREAGLKLFKSSDGGVNWMNEGGSVDLLKNVIAVEGVVSPSRWTAGEPVPAPILSSISPSFAEIGSSLTVEITGNGFVPGVSTLMFSGTGISVGTVSVLSATRIVAAIAISASSVAGFHDVLMTNGSAGTAILQNGFEVRQHFNPSPFITGIAPSLGVRGRSFEAVIRGGGFVHGVSTVTIGNGIDLRLIRVLGDSAIVVSVAVSRGAALGVRDCAVLNPPPGGGGSVLPKSFSVLNPVPTVTSFFPQVVERGQSVRLRIDGLDFVSDTTRVDAGEGVEVDSIVVQSSASLEVKIRVEPLARTGSRNLSVINTPPGGGIAVLPGPLLIVNPAPSIFALVPDSGTVGQMTDVVCEGAGFLTDATSARFGNGATVESLTVLSTSKLKARVQIGLSASLGPRDVTVLNDAPGGGTATLTGKFIVKSPLPTIESITPAAAVSGRQAGVTLVGSGFVPGLTRLDFGSGVKVDSLEFHGTTRIVAWISISSSIAGGVRSVLLTNPSPGGGEACLAGGFVVSNPAPTVARLSASAGSRGSTFTIMLNGTNFIQGVTSLTLGEGVVVNSIRVTSQDRLFAQISVKRSAAPGVRDAMIMNLPPGGGSHAVPGAFVVTNPLPEVREIIPSALCIGDTVSVAMKGTGFLEGATAVDFGPGIALHTMAFDSSGTQLTSIISVNPSAAPGFRSVMVSNAGPGGGSAPLPDAVELVYPVPVLSSIAPLGGNRAQTLEIVVTGRNFIPGATSLSLGDGITVNELRVISSTQVQGTITIGAETALGQRNVVLSNPSPAGGASRLTNAFTVANSAPMLVRVTPSTVARGQISHVVLEGMNFVRGETSVGFGEGITVSSVTVDGLTRITANISVDANAAVGSRNISVTNAGPGGGSSTLIGVFKIVYPAPTIAGLSPGAGFRGKTQTVLVTGSNFEPEVTSVDFGPEIIVASLNVRSPVLLVAEIRVGARAAKGVRTVVVRNKGPGGGAMGLEGAFAVLNPSPTLTNVTPTEGVRGKTLQVSLTGDGYLPGETTVDFGAGIAVSDLAVKSDSEISVILDIRLSAEIGLRTVCVTNAQPGGGSATLTNVFVVKSEVASSVSNPQEQSSPRFALYEPFPNPLNSRTAISYQLIAKSLVSLKVFNLLGMEIAILFGGEQAPGIHQTWLDASKLTSGMYVVRLVTESLDSHERFVASRKIVLLK